MEDDYNHGSFEAAETFRSALKKHGDQSQGGDYFLSGVDLDEESRKKLSHHMMAAHHRFMAKYHKKMMHQE